MISVHKFPLTFGITSLSLPKFAIPLHFGMQYGQPMLWVQVDTNETEREFQSFWVIGTGHHVPPFGVHLGSAIDDAFVWHCFHDLESEEKRSALAKFL